jgi:TetR/AcrR family transcriptional repressor of nem operon
MGRKLEFDKNQALEKVMNSFWAKGYDATSMRDLAQHLGLHLGSVYNALGDKDKVFEDALHLNIQRHVLPHLEALTSSENPLSALDGFSKQCRG